MERLAQRKNAQSMCYNFSMPKPVFEFIIYILHACAEKWSVFPSAAYKKLKDSDCINKLLVPYYDIMHTQSTSYIVGDIEEYLAARGVSV